MSAGCRFAWVVSFLCVALVTFAHAQTPLPLTWDDNYFPQFHIRIKPEDLAKILTQGVADKVPMTLEYQGKTYTGTIRQRLGNSSLCGDKRQFRLDFSGKQTFPDGYVADRFETDRGNCYTLHEWVAWKLLDQAAQRRPDLKVLRKKYNVVAIYFNDELYHVQTLLEDVNKDLLEPQLGTRNITVYENGCYGRTDPRELNGFCQVFSPAQIKEQMQVPSFLYSAAVVQMLGGNDNYPSYPFNHNFVHELAPNRIWFMPDDLDSTMDFSAVRADPFGTVLTEGDSQRHFTELMNDTESRALYHSYLRELLTLLQPEQLKPLVAAKYAQVRETLLASPDLPLGTAWYDYVYLSEIPHWIDERYAFLTTLLEQGTTNRPPVAVIAPLPTVLEAGPTASIMVQLNGTASSDPDNDSLTYSWVVDGQEVGQTAILDLPLVTGSHLIKLIVRDGRDGTGTATTSVEVTLANRPPLAVITGLPASLEATDATGVKVLLNGAASSDPDNDSLAYNWAVDGRDVGQLAVLETTLSSGTHTIVLTVRDGRGGVGTATATIQVTPRIIANQPPTAVITGLPTSLEATDVTGINVLLNGAASSDPDNDSLTYRWIVNGQEIGQVAIVDARLGIGLHTILLTVQDGRGGISTATATLQVTPRIIANRPPVAVIAPMPNSITATDPAGVVVQLNGEGSNDPDGDPLTYIWQVDGQEVGRGMRISVLIGIGSRSIRLTVDDGRGGTNTTTTGLEILPVEMSVQSVSPNVLSRNNAAILVIKGTGFSPQAFVTISGSGVLLDTYYSRSETSLSVYTRVFSFAVSGPRDVTVTNPNGTTATLRGALYIQ